MASRRPFSPAFVFRIGPRFVAVDRIQPVALVLSLDGEHSSLASWADLVPAPTATPWPPRWVSAGEDRLVVEDRPDSPPATLTVGPDGDGRLSLEPTPAELLSSRKYSRLLAGPHVPVTPWAYESVPSGDYSWTARIGHAGAANLTLDGSILDFTHAGTVALACVQKADKRPWPFWRNTELLLLSVDGSGITARTVPNPEIGELCWPSHFHTNTGTEALHEYLEYSLRQVAAAQKMGIQDARIVLRNTLDDPEIEIRFRHPDFPDRKFRRLDRPFNELGNLGEGLRDINISLDEDIESGLLARCVAGTDDPIVYC